jgi:hypothetical protein
MIVFIIILVLVFVLIHTNILIYKENFLSCNKVPSGPYKNKCTNIQYKDNTLYALCLNDVDDNTYTNTQLDLKSCINDINDCDSINIDDGGNLICE